MNTSDTPRNQQIENLTSTTAYDSNGDKLGSVSDVFVNKASGRPDFIEINHGLFGINSSIVPLRGHQLNDGELRLPFEKERIENAPQVDDPAALSDDDKVAFYRHYGLTKYGENENKTIGGLSSAQTDREQAIIDEYERAEANGQEVDQDRLARLAGRREASATGAGTGGAGVAGAGVADNAATNTADTPAATSSDGASLVRSEERLGVDTQRYPTERVVLRKYVVEETQTIEVQVRREEVRLEREPITDSDNYAVDVGPAELSDDARRQLDDGATSLVLYEERVNVEKEIVPVERVTLHKDIVRDTKTITEDVAKERIDTDGADHISH